MAPSRQFTACCFTINNPSEELLESLTLGLVIVEHQPGEAKPTSGVRYLTWQLEVGQNGTRHVQGYVVVWGRGYRFGGWKSLFPRGAHFEQRLGTHGEARDYCQKEDTREEGTDFHEFGALQQPADGGRGARGDLVSVKRRLDAGASELEISDEFFGQWVKYHRAFKAYVGLHLPARSHVTFTTVYWGEPGTGKTMLVNSNVGKDAYWLPKPNGTRVFWDGYEGQSDVVIDEFFGWMPRDLMCRLCDRYPFRVETKGGSVPFVALRIWITSNNPPNAWWPRVGLGPMRRRLSGELGSCFMMSAQGELSTDGVGLEPVVQPGSHLQPDGSLHVE